MTTVKQIVHMLSYASGLGGVSPACGKGPQALRASQAFQQLARQFSERGLDLHWDEPSQPLPLTQPSARWDDIQHLCQALALRVAELTRKKAFFIVSGGDHTSAIGTWSGVRAALPGPLGLIWVDAHMDSHTPQTSVTGRLHGMPLAALLGHGDARFTQLLSPVPKVAPAHLCLIGVRSYEAGEAKLLADLGVRLYFMDEIKKRGLVAVFQEALERVTQGTAGFGLSLDVDSLDPREAPGVDVPEPDGLHLNELADALTGLMRDARLQGLEIAEFNPEKDPTRRTEEAIVRLLQAMMSSNYA